MTDTAPAPAESQAEAPESGGSLLDNVSQQSQGQPEASDFAFVLDKYRAEGRSDNDAAIEQAKAYGELQKRFGGFTGAPESYEFSVSEELGIDLDLENNPMIERFSELSKELQLNNEAANQFLNLYAEQQAAEMKAVEDFRAEQLEALGKDGQERLSNIDAWARANMNPDQYEGLKGLVTDVASVEAVEALIAKTRNAPQVAHAEQAPMLSREELSKMAMARDEHGNPKMNNPEYAAKVNDGYKRLFPEDTSARIVG